MTIRVTMKHIGDTKNFAKFSSDESAEAFYGGNTVLRAWVPFTEFEGDPVPDELEVVIDC